MWKEEGKICSVWHQKQRPVSMAGSYIIKNFIRIKLFRNWTSCISHVINDKAQKETGCPNQDQESSMSGKKIGKVASVLGNFMSVTSGLHQKAQKKTGYISNTQVI